MNVIVTGGTRGLGKSVVEYFLTKKFNVATCSISKKSCEEFNTNVLFDSNRLYIERCDVSKQDEVEKFISNVLKKYQKIDILINNAGIHVPIEKFYNNDATEWINTINVNLNGVFLMSHYVVKHMITQNFGRIINLSGGGATKPMPLYSAYSASKAAIVRLTECMAEELLGYDILVNSIAPGFLATDIHKSSIDAGKELLGDYYEFTLKNLKEGGANIQNSIDLIELLSSKKCVFNGKLISAVFDDWKGIQNSGELSKELFTLRRVDNQFIGEIN